MLGKIAKDINEQRLYIQHDYETFGEYIASVGLDRSTVYRCIQVYEKFVEEYGLGTKQLAEIGYSKLCDIVPVVDDDNKDEWLAKAGSLSRSDLIEEIKAEKGGEAGECQHEWVQVSRCKVCKKVAPCDNTRGE